MKKYLFIVIVFISFHFSTYSQGKNPADYNYEIQFIKTGLQGTELFKVFTYCKKEKDCIVYAKVDAVKAILFKGIPGSGMAHPMVNDVGAEEKYKDFFSEFFKSGGRYLNYVSISNDGSINENDRFKVGRQLKIGVIVSVQKANLRKELEAAGIIKKLDQGF
jgi:hypothetical protein